MADHNDRADDCKELGKSNCWVMDHRTTKRWWRSIGLIRMAHIASFAFAWAFFVLIAYSLFTTSQDAFTGILRLAIVAAIMATAFNFTACTLPKVRPAPDRQGEGASNP